MRRFPLAFLLVGVLGALAAGGAVLGAFEAPTGTDLAVHNGAGQTLAASRVVGHYTASYLDGDVVSFVFVAPDTATEVAKGPTGVVKAHRSVEGSSATGILEPVQALLSINGFTQHGSTYVSVIPVADLVPVDERAFVSGRYETTVRLAAGYVVEVDFDIVAVEGEEHVHEQVHYHLTRIGSWGAS